MDPSILKQRIAMIGIVSIARIFGWLTLVAAGPVGACIVPEGPQAAQMERDEVERDKAIQVSLVLQLVAKADTIVVARSLGDAEGAFNSQFRVEQSIKGRTPVGAAPIFWASPSVPPLACTLPSEIFRNTITFPGETYLLYARGHALLRASKVGRSSNEISLEQELKLISIASTPEDSVNYVHIIAVLAILQFLLFGILVGRARRRHGIKPPATSGHELFERAFRVHVNTLEQLVAFIPALLIASAYWPNQIVAGVGAVWLAGRFLYRHLYLADPARRRAGFLLTVIPTFTLLVACLIGAILQPAR